MFFSLTRKSFVAATLTLLVTLCYANMVSAFSIREFLGLDKAETGQKKPEPSVKKTPENTKTPETQADEPVTHDLDFTEVQKIISVIDENQRKTILANEEAFTTFIRNEAANKSLLLAAHANKIDQDERNLYIARRGAENIIREIYLKHLIASKIPADFPTEEQMKTYFEQNKDKFVLGERMHVWQIFLPVKDASDVKESELLKKQAEALINDLNKNKIDFATAAEKYSVSPASKYNGGYMGLVKISELKPEIRLPLMALAVDKISGPIKTEEGIHILKRGTTVPAQNVGYEEVKEQIRKLSVTQLQNQLRQAIFKQAAETYPVDITDKTIEEWRLKLRTNTATSSATESN